MRRPVRELALVALVLFVFPFAAQAWDAPPAGVISIAEVRARAETGDYLVVQGVVLEQRGQKLFRIEDSTGEMWVQIPDFLLREEGTPETSERIRVAGKYDHKKLDESVEGVRVTTLWRGHKVTGGRGEAAPTTGAAKAAGKTPATSPPPAAAGATPSASDASSASVIRPTAAPEMVQKLAAARREWLDALDELEEASMAYGRALFQAGDAGLVKREVLARNAAAEARVVRANEAIGPLVEEARAAGVSEETLRLYIQMTTRQD